MTGLEGLSLATGGRLLGKLAVPAGRALARKASFRWLVWWRVRKKVDFPCPWRAYRRWLKTLTPDELDKPVEEIHGPLASRLDQALAASSSDWASRDDHLSRALRLVELTYPAIAAAFGNSDRVQLTEHWAGRRDATVRGILLQLAGPSAALSASDLARVLEQHSVARRSVRLQAFGVDEAALSAYFEQITVPCVPVGRVAVLVGDFGCGKSEKAEAWHRLGIRRLSESDSAPFPVWLGARDLLGQTLEHAIEQQFGSAWRSGRGASICLDGLDETDPATAQHLLEAARTLTKTYANVQVLLTTRPGILAPTKQEEIMAAPLIEEEALELVAAAGGKPHDTWRWTADMRATVTRPFFALAAGVLLGGDETPHGEADLIRLLVQRALSTGTERSAITSGEIRAVLKNLAIELTRTGRDGLSFSDRQIVCSSRLVSGRAESSVQFSLPIFQHWFAAQAIIEGDVPAVELVTDATGFSRWRWAAAVAVLSAPNTDTLDTLLGTWVSGNAGAAAWVIAEAFSERREWRSEDDPVLESNSGARLLRALRTWTEALGPLADGVLPAPLVQGPVGLGVTVSGHQLHVAFSTFQPSQDFVTEVPPGVHPLVPDAVPHWSPWISGMALKEDAWPWSLTRDAIAKATLKKLENDPWLGTPEGIWTQERRYDLARRILRRPTLIRNDLPAKEVRNQAVRLFEMLEEEPNVRFELDRTTFFGAELENLISWIDGSITTHLASSLPKLDVPDPKSGWVWDFYSPQRLMEFEVEVYGRACQAYDDALTHSFARLGWVMPGSAIAPFGVILELSFDEGRIGNIPGLTAIRMPMPLMPRFAPANTESIWSNSGRAVITSAKRNYEEDFARYSATQETIRAWLADQNCEYFGGLGWSQTGADNMAHARPASSVAASWLWQDLTTIGLGTGTFPQLQ